MFSSLTHLAPVSFVGYAVPLLPSPCDRPYRLGVLRSSLTPYKPSDALLVSWYILPFVIIKGENRVSQVPGASLLTYHALRPRRPIKILPVTIFTVLTSASLTTSSTTTTLISGLDCLREVHLPCGLLDSLSTLRQFRSINPLIPDLPPTSTQHSVLVSG